MPIVRSGTPSQSPVLGLQPANTRCEAVPYTYCMAIFGDMRPISQVPGADYLAERSPYLPYIQSV